MWCAADNHKYMCHPHANFFWFILSVRRQEIWPIIMLPYLHCSAVATVIFLYTYEHLAIIFLLNKAYMIASCWSASPLYTWRCCSPGDTCFFFFFFTVPLWRWLAIICATFYIYNWSYSSYELYSFSAVALWRPRWHLIFSLFRFRAGWPSFFQLFATDLVFYISYIHFLLFRCGAVALWRCGAG